MTRKRNRLLPKERKAQILSAAIHLASLEGGWFGLKREDIAARASCSPALVTLYYGEMAAFKRAIMRKAVRDGILSIVAQGIVLGDPIAKRAPTELKNQSLQTLG